MPNKVVKSVSKVAKVQRARKLHNRKAAPHSGVVRLALAKHKNSHKSIPQRSGVLHLIARRQAIAKATTAKVTKTLAHKK